MLGTLMFCSKIILEVLPNIHLLGMLTMVYTIVYRRKALIPIYIYVFMNGLFAGFNMWWVPYLYIWTVLWGAVMLLPKKMPKKIACVVYPALCALHGILADYDVDQTYWAFNIGGEYAMTGVDQTEITEGVVYQLVRTK